MSEILSERGLRALLAVIEEGRQGSPTEGVPWATLDQLTQLISCDGAAFTEINVARRHFLIGQWMQTNGNVGLKVTRPDESPMLSDPASLVLWENFHDFLPHAYIDRSGDLSRAIRWSDFYTSNELRRAPLYAEYFRPRGDKHNIRLYLPTLPGQIRCFTLYRSSGSDFTERDRLILNLLRPHLWEIYLDTQRRHHGVPQLSRREWEVLQLANQGYSNADIARKLFIAVSTVRKHMEHIFDRTGVRSRTAAAALMIPHHTSVR